MFTKRILYTAQTMRAFLIILLAMATGIGGWYIGTRSGMIQDPVDTSNSSDSRILENNSKTIRGLGTLEPVSGLINIFAPPGERVATLVDKQPGDHVALDEVLVTLRSRVLRAQDLKLAKARRTDVLNKIEFEKTQARFGRETAELALAESIAVDEKIASQSKNIDLLKKQRLAANTLLNRFYKLQENEVTKDLVNQIGIDKQVLLVEQLDLQIEQAQLQIKAARSTADRGKQVAQNNLRTIDHAIDNADSATPISSIDATIALAQLACDMTQIRSPIEGAIILDIIVRQGDSVANRPIMILGNVSEMVCVVEINDSLLQRIDLEKHNNLRAKITSPAFSDSIMGTVIRKGVMIGPPSLKDPNPFARIDRRTGTITIKLDNSKLAASFVNLQVDVEIEVDPGAFE